MIPAALVGDLQVRELISATAVDAAIARLGAELSVRLSGREVVCLVVLNGGLVFAGKLLPRLELQLRLDYVHVSRYGDATRGNELRWIHDVPEEVAGQTVLLLDDIYDQGYTLEALVERCLARGASEVVSAVLVHKHHPRPCAALRPDFVGLECEDLFIFGCGMDYQGYGRNLPAIHVLDQTPLPD